MVASLFLSLCSMVCTAERFCLNTEGNDEGFVLVVTVFEEVSIKNKSKHVHREKYELRISHLDCLLHSNRRSGRY